MGLYKENPKELVHDVLNFYGIKATCEDAFTFIKTVKEPTPYLFAEWIEKKTALDGR